MPAMVMTPGNRFLWKTFHSITLFKFLFLASGEKVKETGPDGSRGASVDITVEPASTTTGTSGPRMPGTHCPWKRMRDHNKPSQSHIGSLQGEEWKVSLYFPCTRRDFQTLLLSSSHFKPWWLIHLGRNQASWRQLLHCLWSQDAFKDKENEQFMLFASYWGYVFPSVSAAMRVWIKT